VNPRFFAGLFTRLRAVHPQMAAFASGTRVAPRTPMATAHQLVMPVRLGRDHVRGSRRAPVTLLEYGDYECPHCGVAHAFVEDVRHRFIDDLQFAFRHSPLRAIHPHAERVGEAAEAAGAQGQFWAMHDLNPLPARPLPGRGVRTH
jgi:protein-disulfide isomerase